VVRSFFSLLSTDPDALQFIGCNGGVANNFTLFFRLRAFLSTILDQAETNCARSHCGLMIGLPWPVAAALG